MRAGYIAPAARVVYGLDAAAWRFHYECGGVHLWVLGTLGATWDWAT